MRKSLTPEIETKRVRVPGFEIGSGPNGFFVLQGPTGAALRIRADDGTDPTSPAFGFEHVSVTVRHRDPTRREMCYIKNLFWPGNEAVMQLYVPESDFQNSADHALHLWRPVSCDIPLPPPIAFSFFREGNGYASDEAYAAAMMRSLVK